MINPHEIRLGNYLMYSSSLQVNDGKMREILEHPDRFSPIELKNQWLQDFGFSYDEHTLEWYINIASRTELRIYIGDVSRFDHYFSIEDKACYVAIDKKDMTVHWLQNLYFSLTGKELTKQ